VTGATAKGRPKWIAAPNSPQPPQGWTPEPGWRPDPAWGPPPPGWVFWFDGDDPADSRTAADPAAAPGSSHPVLFPGRHLRGTSPRVKKTLAAGAAAAVLLAIGVATGSQHPSSSSAGARSASANPTRPTDGAATTTTTAAAPSAAPAASQPAMPSTDELVAAAPPRTALALLGSLQVRDRAPKTGYDRDQFGPRWADVDRNGCDTRNDILRRDLTATTVKAGTNGCVVMTGSLRDPYTGTTTTFTKADADTVQIDHVVSLSDAWETGAQAWTAGQRLAFANDPLNLLAVDRSTNAQKSDGDAATWLPPHKSFRCPFVARQTAVKAKYQLWVTPAERDAIARVLAGCAQEPAPLGGQPTEAATGPATQAPATPPAAPPAASPESAPGDVVVHPGSYCSPSGATGRTSAGTAMVCGTTPHSPTRARWHTAGN
jgi:hypothetical protein